MYGSEWLPLGPDDIGGGPTSNPANDSFYVCSAYDVPGRVLGADGVIANAENTRDVGSIHRQGHESTPGWT